MLAWRLNRTRAAAQAPARQVAADEHGQRCAALVAARAAAYTNRTPATRAAIATARAAAAQARDAARAARDGNPPALVTAAPPLGEDAATGPPAGRDQKAPA